MHHLNATTRCHLIPWTGQVNDTGVRCQSPLARPQFAGPPSAATACRQHPRAKCKVRPTLRCVRMRASRRRRRASGPMRALMHAGVGHPHPAPGSDHSGAAALRRHRRGGVPGHACPRHGLVAAAASAAGMGPAHRRPADKPARRARELTAGAACGGLERDAACPRRDGRRGPRPPAQLPGVRRRVAVTWRGGLRRLRRSPRPSGAAAASVLAGWARDHEHPSPADGQTSADRTPQRSLLQLRPSLRPCHVCLPCVKPLRESVHCGISE